MKLFGPDGSNLMVVESVTVFGRDIQIKGKIMGAMPMTAVLRPREMRRAFRLITLGVLWQIVKMFFSTESERA